VDDQGRVVAAAEVFIIAEYSGERHSTKYLLSAISDARGNWSAELGLTPAEFKHQSCKNVLLFGYKAGQSCDFHSFPFLTHDDPKKESKNTVTRDLEFVLPSSKATLSVKATRGSTPQVNAIIRIANEHWPKLWPANIKHAGDAGAGERLDRILHPAAHTDEHGVARFDDLAPGTFRILTADRDSQNLFIVQVDPEGQGRSPNYQGVPLRPGEHRHFTVGVYEQSNSAPLQILQADGQPASWEKTVYEYYHGTRFFEGGVGSGSWIDEKGCARFNFGKPGLWRMHARERGSGGEINRVFPPRVEAAGVLAVSPLLRNAPFTVLTSRWVERDELRRPNRDETWRDAEFFAVEGGVFFADGKTPALGARLLTLEPTSARVVHQAKSDALGRFLAKTYVSTPPSARPADPMILAMLPGQCGATVFPFSAKVPPREWSVTLPKAMSLHGRVTVGGKSAKDWNNQFHVLAAYEGRGGLGELLSILVSPDKDGSFELAGLTPGRYRIQASMDDIWLSPSVSLVVDADGLRSEPLLFDIGRPGVPSVVRCIDAAGKPVVGIKLELRRPSGPLTDRLWPAMFTSDGAGIVNLPPLEVGRHVLCVPSLRDPAKRSEQTITIDELEPDFQPLDLKLVID
jgi:hypothetical protein